LLSLTAFPSFKSIAGRISILFPFYLYIYKVF